jgi:hypothetical protein
MTAKLMAVMQLLRQSKLRVLFNTTSGLALAGMLLLGVPSKRRRVSTLLSLMVAGLLTLSACGGGGSSSKLPPDPGTLPGRYPVVVTATSGSLKPKTVSFTLSVI